MNNYSITPSKVRATFTVGRWTVKVVPAVDGYRLTGHADLDADSIVQFFDNTQSKEAFGPDGQFVSSYYLRSTLFSFERKWEGGGLNLCGYEPAWTVSAEDYAKIRKYLKALL